MTNQNFSAVVLVAISISGIFGCSACPGNKCQVDNSWPEPSVNCIAHIDLIQLMYIDPSLLTWWGEESIGPSYYSPNELDCLGRQDVTLEITEIASRIDSIHSMVFSGSNATDEMLVPLLESESLGIIYLDGLDISQQTIEAFVRMENVYTISLSDISVDREWLQALRVEYPDKEIIHN